MGTQSTYLRVTLNPHMAALMAMREVSYGIVATHGW